MTEPVRRSLSLRCPPAHAFTVFVERVDAWWPPSHRRDEKSEMVIESQVGGRFFERLPSGEEIQLGEVLRYEPPHKLSYSFRPGSITLPTLVEISFEEHGAETVVHVVHSEGQSNLLELWDERAKAFVRGWDKVLPLYRACVHEFEGKA